MCISTTSHPSSAADRQAVGRRRSAVTSFHVVAPAATAARATAGFMVSTEIGTAVSPRSARITGNDAGDLVLGADRSGARPGGFAADVEHVGALGDQPAGVGQRGRGIEEAAAVRKTVTA